jgi:hypothetical protein
VTEAAAIGVPGHPKLVKSTAPPYFDQMGPWQTGPDGTLWKMCVRADMARYAALGKPGNGTRPVSWASVCYASLVSLMRKGCAKEDTRTASSDMNVVRSSTKSPLGSTGTIISAYRAMTGLRAAT